MSTQNKAQTNFRAHLTWLFAISPFVLLIAFITMALHVRLGFGHWPDQAVDDFPTAGLMAHDLGFIALMLFAILGAIHIPVTFIHHRELRVRLRVVLSQALMYALGWILLFLVTEYAPARFVTWFTD